MGPAVTVLVLAALIAASNGLPRLARDDKGDFLGDGTSEIATAMLQSYIDEDKNTAFSPMGYSALMAILAEGARGDTKTQLVNALHLPPEEHMTRAAYKHVLQNLKEEHQLNVPEFHTWFYVYKNFSIEPEFKSILLENYLTEVKNVEPLYEDIKAEPPTPELEAMMHLDHKEDNDKIKHEKEDMVPEKQSTMSEDKHTMHEKEETDSENKDAKKEMTDEKKDMMPEKQEEMTEKVTMCDKKEQMPEKQDIKSHEDKMHEKETEFVVTPEMIENKPDSIKDKFLEDLLNKELEDKRRKEAKEKEEMKKEGEIKDGEIKDESSSTSNNEGSMMMSGDDNKNDTIKREIMRLRRSVMYSSHDPVADKKQGESMTEDKKESMMNEEVSLKEGILMEESMLTQAMKEAAIIEEAMKDKKHHSSQEREMEEDPKKEMSFSEMQPTSGMDKKPAMGDMQMEMPGMDKTEKEKLSMSEKDKKKPYMMIEGLETMGRSKRISRGVLGNQDVTSGISGNSIVKKASEKPGESVMIVFNALYYKGSWATSFNPQKRGQLDVFYTSATEKVTVPIMQAEGTFNIASIPELDSTAVELPYQGGRYSLLVVLPNQRDGLRPMVADHLAKYPLKNVFKQLSPKQAQVCLPSFEVETTTNPKDALHKMGVMDVFSKEKANLAGISKESGLFVDELAQFVTIKVEPNHSETNYLTGSNVDGPETRTEEGEKFVADHPFLFFVVDKKNHNMIVVGGKVTDPSYKTSPFIKKVKF